MDDDGKPTVVEVKLARNGESRRDVLAQVFDYTASLAEYTIDELDRQLDNELENQLQLLAGEGDDARAKYNRLWDACADAMRVGSVRVVVAMDEGREDLERIVRFVNEHSNLNVRLLVVRKYVSGTKTVLVPEFIVHGEESGVGKTSGRRPGLSDYQVLQQEYWTEYLEYMKGSPVPCGPALPKHSIVHPTGSSSLLLFSVASMFTQGVSGKSPELRAEFGIRMDNPAPAFDWFEKRRSAIEKALGSPLRWDNETYTRYYRVYLAEKGDLRDRDAWRKQFAWLREHAEKFYDVFIPLIKEYEASQA